MKESDIIYQHGDYWIMKDSRTNYVIMKDGLTHSESIDGVAYPDLSIAKVRCDYLAKRALTRKA